MLRYIYADELTSHPQLAESMFRDRADQFHHRLKWDVKLAEDGTERDQYDVLNPLYVIWENSDGCHGGSMRFLPTRGATMINDHFLSLTDGREIRDDRIWECTRFCLAPKAESRVSAALMLGGMELGLGLGLTHAIGVFDARMIRIYRRLGWGPIILGSDGVGRHAISAGLWAFEPALKPRLLRGAGVSAEVSRFWFQRAMGTGEAGANLISA